MDIEETIRFVINAHGDQKYGDLPYIVHPLMVARHFEDPIIKTVALLHDVVEDTNITLNDIELNFGDEIATAVDFLTRRNGELYLDTYIRRVARYKVATKVKIADLEENLHSAKFVYFNRYNNLIHRYEKALEYLCHS